MKQVVLNGMLGEPIPYLLRSDWMITCVLSFCVLLVSYVFSQKKKYLKQKIKSFFVIRERSSLFDEVTAMDARHILLLLLNSCMMIAFCIYHYFSCVTPMLFERISHVLLLGILVGCVIVFLGIKWSFYSFINWVFFQKERNVVWIDSFVNLNILLGLSLLPVVLLIVYFNLTSYVSLFLVIFLIIFAKIALLWKCFSNFFGKIYGSLHLILYFCALEILPDLILWKGMEMLNNNLILNF